MDTGGSPRRQDTMGGAPAQTRSERVLEKPNEPPLSEGHTSGSGEGRMEHQFEIDGYRLERQRKSSNSQPRKRKYRQFESLDDDLDEEDASKQGRDSYASREKVPTKVPTDQELLEKMLKLQLEAQEESTMAFELIKFIKSMLEG
ncbi:hypothetical protein Tco_0010250 [Tanacetum coccineum]